MKNLLLLASLTCAYTFAQCGNLVPNPVTHKLDCAGTAPISCVGSPGNTPGAYLQQCQTSGGAVYACNNAAGCTVAGDWVAQAGSGSFTALTGDATSTSTGGATSVVKVNGGAISTTGTIQKSNGSGQLLDATAGDINALDGVTSNSTPPLVITAAKTYYIAPAAISGGTCTYNGDAGTTCTPSDSNAGTSKAAPWATVAHAASVLANAELYAPVTLQLANTISGSCYRDTEVVFNPVVMSGEKYNIFEIGWSQIGGPYAYTDVYPWAYLELLGDTTTPANINWTAAATCAGTTSTQRTAVRFVKTNAVVHGINFKYWDANNVDNGAVQALNHSTLYLDNITETGTGGQGSRMALIAYETQGFLGPNLNGTESGLIYIDLNSHATTHTPAGYLSTNFVNNTFTKEIFLANEGGHLTLWGATTQSYSGSAAYTIYKAFARSIIDTHQAGMAGIGASSITLNGSSIIFLSAAQFSAVFNSCGSTNNTCTVTSIGQHCQTDTGGIVTDFQALTATNPDTYGDAGACIYTLGSSVLGVQSGPARLLKGTAVAPVTSPATGDAQMWCKSDNTGCFVQLGNSTSNFLNWSASALTNGHLMFGAGNGGTKIGDLSGDCSTSGSGVTTCTGINSVPLCSGFTPTNGQFLEYTTGGTPNPCYSAATASGGTVDANAVAGAIYCADSSVAANTITCSTGTSFPTYAAGQSVIVKLANSVTGATTIAVGGQAAKSVTKNGTTALASGDMLAGGMYLATYDGTRFVAYIPFSGSGISGSGTTNNLAKFASTSSVGNANATDDGTTFTITDAHTVLSVGAGLAAATVGEIGYDTTQKQPVVYDSSSGQSAGVNRLLYAHFSTTDSLTTATISTTETSFAQTFEIPANFFIPGKILRISLGQSNISSASTIPTIHGNIRLSTTDQHSVSSPTGTLIFQSQTGATSASLNNNYGMIIIIQGTAAPSGSAPLEFALTSGGQPPFSGSNTIVNEVSVPTNGPLWITFSETCVTNCSTAGNSANLRQLIIEEMN